MHTPGDDSSSAATIESRPYSTGWYAATRRFVRIAVASAVCGWLWTGCTFVSLDEVVLYERLGRLQPTPLTAGCHFLLPSPWGRAHRYPRSRIQLVAVETSETEGPTPSADGANQSMVEANHRRAGGVTLLCGSTTEVIRLRAQLAFRSVDTGQGLRWQRLTEAEPELHLRRLAERLLSRLSATRTLDSLLSCDKAKLSSELTQSLQKSCDHSNLGLEVLALEIVEASPPAEVVPVFLDVTNATIDAERDFENARIQAVGELNRMSMMSDSLVADARAAASVRLTSAATQAITLQALADAYVSRFDTVRHRMQMERWGELLGQRRVVLWDADLSSSVSLSLDSSSDEERRGVLPGATP